MCTVNRQTSHTNSRLQGLWLLLQHIFSGHFGQADQIIARKLGYTLPIFTKIDLYLFQYSGIHISGNEQCTVIRMYLPLEKMDQMRTADLIIALQGRNSSIPVLAEYMLIKKPSCQHLIFLKSYLQSLLTIVHKNFQFLFWKDTVFQYITDDRQHLIHVLVHSVHGQCRMVKTIFGNQISPVKIYFFSYLRTGQGYCPLFQHSCHSRVDKRMFVRIKYIVKDKLKFHQFLLRRLKYKSLQPVAIFDRFGMDQCQWFYRVKIGSYRSIQHADLLWLYRSMLMNFPF